MSIFNIFYSKHYKDYHNYDDRLFNSDPMRKIYEKAPAGARMLSLIVMPIWTGVKTVLSPVVDLVCLVVFPVMAFKSLDKSYLYGCVNAIVDLAFWAGYIALIVVVATHHFSGHLFVVSLVVSTGGCYASQSLMKKLFMGLRGPIHPEDDKGLMSTLFKDFKITDMTNVIFDGDHISEAQERFTNFFGEIRTSFFD
ncbi:MAG: hypothetical protein KDK55_06585 [Chlamydiia bacterium]|nr:hypothetical protein [Chlamydiia bacterium]